VRAAGLESAFGDETARATSTADADELAADLEALGPTFVKLGQLLSTRADLIPAPYLVVLSRLQDNLEPFVFHEVERTLFKDR